MCQQHAGEQAYMYACEKSYRKRGYEAQREGRARDSHSYEADLVYLNGDIEHWQIGWDIAAGNRELW